MTDEFARDASWQVLWLAFQRKNGLTSEPLTVIVDRLRATLTPVMKARKGC